MVGANVGFDVGFELGSNVISSVGKELGVNVGFMVGAVKSLEGGADGYESVIVFMALSVAAQIWNKLCSNKDWSKSMDIYCSNPCSQQTGVEGVQNLSSTQACSLKAAFIGRDI